MRAFGAGPIDPADTYCVQGGSEPLGEALASCSPSRQDELASG
ncbi:hypothetical protein [Paraliomyxa miuraensis]|nr:hypothetical protein [Paraliomyxa miuraensis]MCX4248116.1 hypothetical protein [Paraliomyxa miuraensis]